MKSLLIILLFLASSCATVKPQPEPIIVEGVGGEVEFDLNDDMILRLGQLCHKASANGDKDAQIICGVIP